MSADVIEYDLLKGRLSIKGDFEAPLSTVSLISMFILTLLLTIAELVVAQVTHSITLLVLTHQNIYNLLTLGVSCVTNFKDKSNASLKNTFGWRRMEVVGSIASLVFLFSLCFATFIEALQTVFHNDHLDTMHHPDWILFLICAHLAVWMVTFVIIGGYTFHQQKAVGDVNKKATKTKTNPAYFARDLGGAMFNLLTSILVYFEMMSVEYSAYLDPVISMIFIVFLIWTCVPLVRDACMILLQTIPGNIEVPLLKKFLLQKFSGILGLHEFHIWTFTPGEIVLTGHIIYKDKTEFEKIHQQVDAFFISQGITQITIQPEFPKTSHPSEDDISNCALSCKTGQCEEMVCCIVAGKETPESPF